ncbi:hypothetical protein KIN20_015361 [Parelaphostrongylus tenuis]|uniref:Uncharacterized protein n=1 Tax=Parelaphostrongylus tenuis TaxID=148309 RepID=A0AAD5MES7_PARTN|nr:hypothetical protein KIN20_015361 [Parelaphostrongylus tenuis]
MCSLKRLLEGFFSSPRFSSTRPFIVSGFTLPVAMVYSTKAEVSTSLPGIATSQAGARAFVQRLVMQTVFDVLDEQARSAFLPDAVISAILGQVSVNITYEPLDCEDVAITLKEMGGFPIIIVYL